MRTDYAGHEKAYRKFKAAGNVGWNPRISHPREEENRWDMFENLSACYSQILVILVDKRLSDPDRAC